MWEEDLKWSQHLVNKKKQLEASISEKKSNSADSEKTDVKTHEQLEDRDLKTDDDNKIRAR